MTMTVTRAAGSFMRGMLPGACRLTVTSGGCAGFVVQFSIEAAPQPGDASFDVDGLRLFLPPDTRLLLEGATIDFRNDALAIINPNVSDCGCGSRTAGRGGRHATAALPGSGCKR